MCVCVCVCVCCNGLRQFGINTFTGQEHGTGDEKQPPSKFTAPVDLSTDQWLQACVAMGGTYAVFTAKVRCAAHTVSVCLCGAVCVSVCLYVSVSLCVCVCVCLAVCQSACLPEIAALEC